MPKQDAVYYRRWRAEQSARRKANARPVDLPEGAECKTCANMPGRRAHSCPATLWLLDEPVCNDCAAGEYHGGGAPQVVRMKSRRVIRRGAVA